MSHPHLQYPRPLLVSGGTQQACRFIEGNSGLNLEQAGSVFKQRSSSDTVMAYQSRIDDLWIIGDYLPRNQHLLSFLRYAIPALFTLAFAIYIMLKVVKLFMSAEAISTEQVIANPRSDQQLANFLGTNLDIRRMVISKLSARDMIRFSVVEKDWRTILQERIREPEEIKVKDWYFPLWFQNLHPDSGLDLDLHEPSPSLPTRRHSSLRWHGVHHDNTSHTDEHSLPFLDFLWDVPGNPPLGFVFAATSSGLLLLYKFIYSSPFSYNTRYDRPEMDALLTLCNPFTKQSRDLPSPVYGNNEDITNICDSGGNDMHLVVDDTTLNAYKVLTVASEFVKEWSSVSNEWTTSNLCISHFIAFSSSYYQGFLYVLRKCAPYILVVTLLKRNESGTWVVDDGVNDFATVYNGEEMYREHFGSMNVEEGNLHLVICNDLLYAVMVTEEEDTLMNDNNQVQIMEFHVFELPKGYRSFVRVAQIPFRFFTEMSSEYKYKRHDGQWYQGWRQEKFCCTSEGKQIWIACQGYLFRYDVVAGRWTKREYQHINNFEDSISIMPFKPSFVSKP